MSGLEIQEMHQRGAIFQVYLLQSLSMWQFGLYARLVAAAAFGHSEEVKHLIFDQKLNPDQTPLEEPLAVADYSTPILAAIGVSNAEVVRLLVFHPEFDPTRIIRGETYAQIAKRRRGIHREEEIEILLSAFREYKPKHALQTVQEAQPIPQPSEKQPEPHQEVLAPEGAASPTNDRHLSEVDFDAFLEDNEGDNGAFSFPEAFRIDD